MSSRFGPLLRGLRVAAGLTQEQLAERAGLGVRTVQRLETGTPNDARMGTVKQVAHALADTAGRDREEVWQELLAAHRDTGTPGGPAKAVSPPDGPSSTAPGTDVLAETAGSLARDVHSRWLREEEQRRVRDPFPLPVRWRAAPVGLLDHWDNITAAPPGTRPAPPLSLAGELADIADLYRRVPSGRLVVLGGAGAGKTVLMLRFVLDYLAVRTTADPVPVVFSIGAWDPTATPLRDWLVERLLRDHPNLAARAPGQRATLAAVLLDAGRILPVLDGFDEIATGLHGAALHELSAITLPLLLTSRPEEFTTATATGLLRRAAGIELTPLTTDDLTHYLPRTARPTRRNHQPGTVWDPVLEQLRDRPGSPLAAVLSTPLMVLLARTRYSDAPGQDPAELLDTTRFPTGQSIEQHLLAGFVPTVYHQRPATRTEHRTRTRTWQPERARAHLTHLAEFLDRPGRRDHQDLAWWRLCDMVGTPARILAITLASTLVTVLAVLLALGLLSPADPARIGGVGLNLVRGVTIGPIVGLACASMHSSAVAFRRTGFAPSRTRVRLPGRGPRLGGSSARRIRRVAGAGALGGFVLGLVVGPVIRLLSMLLPPDRRSSLHSGGFLYDVLATSVVLAAASGLALGLITALEAPLDPASAATPATSLTINRDTVVRQALLIAPVVACTTGLLWVLVTRLDGGQPGSPLPPQIVAGIMDALICIPCYLLSFTAWGNWLLFARLWLPLTGRLPWATMAFLEDAYQRGVLRRAGAVYQFRHARLQHHLAASRDRDRDGDGDGDGDGECAAAPGVETVRV